jgi:hypothetical protein
VIKKLSKEQESQLAVYRDKWLKIGLCTKRADRPLVEALMKQAYKVARQKKPSLFIWTDSPIQMLIAAKIIKESAKCSTLNVESQVWLQVESQVGSQVWLQVWPQVWSQVQSQVWLQVQSQVGSQVWSQVKSQVKSQVWLQVKSQDLLKEWNELYFWGQHNAGIISFYDFLLEQCKLKACEKIEPLIDISKHVGWTLMYEGVVIFSEKPSEIHLNKKGQLHNTAGPALSYADGYSIYAKNGKTFDNLMELSLEDKLGIG